MSIARVESYSLKKEDQDALQKGPALPFIVKHSWLASFFHKTFTVCIGGQDHYLDEGSFKSWRERNIEWIFGQIGLQGKEGENEQFFALREEANAFLQIPVNKIKDGEQIKSFLTLVRKVENVKNQALGIKLDSQEQLLQKQKSEQSSHIQESQDKLEELGFQKQRLEGQIRKFRFLAKQQGENLDTQLYLQRLEQSQMSLNSLEEQINYHSAQLKELENFEESQVLVEGSQALVERLWEVKELEVEQILLERSSRIGAFFSSIFSKGAFYEFIDQDGRTHLFSVEKFDKCSQHYREYSQEKFSQMKSLCEDLSLSALPVDLQVEQAVGMKSFFEGLDQERQIEEMRKKTKKNLSEKSCIMEEQIQLLLSKNKIRAQRTSRFSQDHDLIKKQLDEQEALLLELSLHFEEQVEQLNKDFLMIESQLSYLEGKVKDLQDGCHKMRIFLIENDFSSQVMREYDKDVCGKRGKWSNEDSKRDIFAKIEEIYGKFFPKNPRIQEQELDESLEVVNQRCQEFIVGFTQRQASLEAALGYVQENYKQKWKGRKKLLESFEQERASITTLFSSCKNYQKELSLLKEVQQKQSDLLNERQKIDERRLDLETIKKGFELA